MKKARYKARLTAKGFIQSEGINFNKVFSPVVKHSSIRILLSLFAYENLELEKMDVKITFLHRELEETIYMQKISRFFGTRKRTKGMFALKVFL